MLARKQIDISDKSSVARGRVIRRAAYSLFAIAFAFLGQLPVAAQQTESKSGVAAQASFEVRFKAFDNVYLNLGPGDVLLKGMKLVVKPQSGSSNQIIAELKVKTVSPTSAICEVLSMEGDVAPGDRAYLTQEAMAIAARQQSATAVASRNQLTSSAQSSSTLSKGVQEASRGAAPAQKPANAATQTVATLASPVSKPMGPANQAIAAASTATTSVKSPSVNQQPTSSAPPSSVEHGAVAQGSTIRKEPAAPIISKQVQQTTAAQSTTASATTAQLTTVVSKPQTLIAAVQPQQAPSIAQANPAMWNSAPSPAEKQVQPVSASKQVAKPSPASASTTAAQVNAVMSATTVSHTQTTANSGASQQAVVSVQSSSTDAPQSSQADVATSFPDLQTIFKVKFVAQDTVYLSAGTAAGLTAGMKLTVKHSEIDVNEKGTLAKASQAPVIAELEVISVASSSAVCTIQKKTGDIKPGDLAFMDQATAEVLAQKRALSPNRKFPQVISFNEGDPLEEEVRAEVPKPPLPEVNRIRGRFGFDYGDIQSTGSVLSNNSQFGVVVRTDFTRIGGSYWNLSGYWRGRINKTSNAEQPTLQDLINRTYHLNLSYSNPMSPWVAGFGRLYLPWATSLDTIDGGYFGRKAGKHVLLGIFAGSTPDPTSWDYNPDRRIGGTFLNLEGGSFDSLRFTSTTGIALSTLKWQVDRPFVFFESGLYYKRYISIYDSTQADNPRPMPGITAPGPGLNRNFLTLRVQPHERISFDVNHNYFRDVPTFSTALISTGLLDKYLFQGLSTGARVEPIRHITFYASVGKSSRTGDTSSSWNEMYGVTLAQIPKIGLRVDARNSRFDSSFGNGKYRSLSLGRSFGDALRLEGQVGEQYLTSQLTTQTYSRFVNATLESNLGKNYFIQGAYTVNRGGTLNYNQWTITFGYRFDNRSLGVGF